jgi:hypothetical protein
MLNHVADYAPVPTKKMLKFCFDLLFSAFQFSGSSFQMKSGKPQNEFERVFRK